MWVFIARSWQWNVTQTSSLMRGTVVMGCSLKMQLEDVAQDLHQKLQNDLALCYEAELSLDGIGYITKACPVQAWKERLWKCTEANFPWIIPPLLQVLSCGAGRNIHNDMMETCPRKRAFPNRGGDAPLHAEPSVWDINWNVFFSFNSPSCVRI